MGDIQKDYIATELFQQSLISRTELAEFKAQEEALYEVFEYTRDYNEKKSDIRKKI
ncbi:hypothetical protein [Chitinivibrio alkaliphilus]|uniref:Uncharacterized protein n=1 Tax=Chitinivibrio alkaliphilus ACht1 TaxID=1313304 RepID=U7D3A7_9BACT|nr:hypothetical protein [Chitinivibrio alkaliphilus]ERP30989.1 hypothetical protein CALK_2126 [Chitinivibrio alkaliphilus ACht1]